MSKNIESARAGIAKFNDGQMEAFLADLDPECVWVSPEGSLIPGTFKGPQQILRDFFMPLGEQFDLKIKVDSYHDVGDAVVIRGAYDATHRASGRSAILPMVQLASWRDGKLVRQQDYFDTALARDIVEGKRA